MGLCRLIEVVPRGAWLGLRRACVHVHANVAKAGKINHQTAVADGVAGHVVSSASDSEWKAMITCVAHCADHVRCSRDPGYEGWAAVDHAVEDLARSVVFGILFSDQPAVEIQRLRDCHAGTLACRWTRQCDDWEYTSPVTLAPHTGTI